MIRTSKHFIDKTQETNTNKLVRYSAFLTEMRRCASIYVDYLWNTHYEWKDKDNNLMVLDIKNKQYHCPPYFDYNLIPLETKLSARALSSLVTQCCGMVKAVLEPQNHRQHIYDKKLKNNEKIAKKLKERIEEFEPTKPKTEKINIELSSKCCDFKDTNNYFNGFLRLKSIGKEYGFIKIPLRFHKQSNKWKKKSTLMNSFLFCDNKIELRWESFPIKKEEGITVGADQGKTDVLCLGDKQVTPKTDKHGHSLDSIVERLTRKKKGSKNFKKTQSQRKNFINWCINQLNFNNIKHVKLEKLFDMGRGKRTSRKLRHWCGVLISEKLIRLLEELGVQVTEQASAYKSQRCSDCGMVLKRNRKKKGYVCENCGLVIDADYNACLNHEAELPEIPIWLSNLHLNKTSGFFWKPEGYFDVDGRELRVPCSEKK